MAINWILFFSFLFFTLDHQRIALVYFIVALIEAFTVKVRPTMVRSGPYAIFNAYRWQWYTILILPDSSITLYCTYLSILLFLDSEMSNIHDAFWK
jgi:heparan-alpha-glucosaminide N-acetyltransferase